MTMSEKDKNTIIIAVVALLILGIALLGIKPAFTSMKETKAKNAELSATKESMQTEINALPTYKTNLATAKSEYSATAARVFGDLDNDMIHDAVIDNFVTPLGLSISGLSIAGTNEQGMNYYKVSTEGGEGGASEGSIRMASVTADVYGSTDQVIALVDKINATEGTFLQSVSFANANNESAVSVVFTLVLSDTFAQ